MNGINKVIGIGLPKTATSSLAVTLSNNNIPTIHFGSLECEEIREKMYKGIYRYDVLDRYKGITNAFEMVFPQIDKAYPGSKFILTIRNKDEWLASAERHRWSEAGHHLITFGTYVFNRDRFSFVYDMHLDMVERYFVGRNNDLLIIDITKDKEYIQKICDFLNTPVIDGTLVHANRSK